MQMQLPDIFSALQAVFSRDEGALKWGNPEPWVHAELFAEFNQRAKHSGWVPFDTEVPYVTNYPVQTPKLSNRDWISSGAIKWVDLCLRSINSDEWCWFEFKVRHAGMEKRANKAVLEARDAFRKDIVALSGFDTAATADIWSNPDYFTKAYWFESALKPYAEDLRNGNHHFVSTFIQLGDNLNEEIWNEVAIKEHVNSWKSYRCKQRGEVCNVIRDIKITFYPYKSHSIILAKW